MTDERGGARTSIFQINRIPFWPIACDGATVHTILVVDDDEDIRNVLQLVLKKAGYRPLLADSGRQAIDLMKHDHEASSVAAILCDLEMPDMDGATVIAHFQTHYPMIPIVVLSGASPTQFLDAIGNQGVGDWIRKPATNDAVLERVRSAVHLFELRQADRRLKNLSTP
jgi:CheY-like chemotaxis protein